MNLMSVFAELSLDSTKYEQGLKSAKTQAGKFEKEQSGLEKAVSNTTSDLDKQKTSTNKLETAMNGASKIAGGFGTAITKIGSVAKTAVAGFTAVVGALTAVSASTVEAREDLNKLDTAFQMQGKTTEEARKVYSDFYTVLGETDTAVEASNLLVQLTQDNEELAKWGTIATGVMATFPDSLPIESLIEASNETAKVGQVTGSLADALNWAGISEEKFNEQLQSLGNEQERVAFITETLNKEYKEAGDLYKENNKSIIDQRKAQEKLTNALNDLGEAFQPVVTFLTNLGAEILPHVTEGVTGLVNAFNTGGIEGFFTYLSEAFGNLLVKAIEYIPQVIEIVSTIFHGILNVLKENTPLIAEALTTGITSLINLILEMLPEFIILGLNLILNMMQGIAEELPKMIDTFIEGILKLVDYVLDNLNMFIEAAIEIILALALGLIEALPKLLEKIPEIITKLVTELTKPEMMAKIINAGLQLIIALAVGLVQSVGTLIASVPTLISSLWDNFKKVITETDWLQLGKDITMGIVNGLGSVGSAIWNGIKGVGNSIVSGFKDFFNINSPSKLMEDTTGIYVGQGVTSGMVKGVEGELANTEKTIGNMITGMNFGSPQVDLSQDYTIGTSMQDQFINNVITLDGEVLANSTNKINDRKNIQTMFA